ERHADPAGAGIIEGTQLVLNGFVEQPRPNTSFRIGPHLLCDHGSGETHEALFTAWLVPYRHVDYVPIIVLNFAKIIQGQLNEFTQRLFVRKHLNYHEGVSSLCGSQHDLLGGANKPDLARFDGSGYLDDSTAYVTEYPHVSTFECDT